MASPAPEHGDDVAQAHIVIAKVSDDLEELEYVLQKLYGGPSMDLDPKVQAILDRIDARLEKIVPAEDY